MERALRTIEVEIPGAGLGALLPMLRGHARSANTCAASPALPALRYVRTGVVLDPVQIAAYSRVCGFADSQGVPLTYPQLLAFPLVMAFLGSADCPWPAMGMVHLANRIEQHARLYAGDLVRVELQTGALSSHDKGQLFTLDTRALRADTLVWQATQTLLRTGVAAPGGPAYVSAVAPFPPLSPQTDITAARDIGRRYARVSGDYNPIHLSWLTARLFGFRRALAHGMWTKARALAAVMPPDAVDRATATVEFKSPLYLPAQATLWTGAAAQGRAFEVRSARGERLHLRGQFSHAPGDRPAAT